VRTRGMDKMTLAATIMTHRTANGMMGTSDFANLLANVANKRLRNVYDENPGSYQCGPAAHRTRPTSRP
jgi:hypothetical protein